MKLNMWLNLNKKNDGRKHQQCLIYGFLKIKRIEILENGT